jgi:hypothetical protein
LKELQAVLETEGLLFGTESVAYGKTCKTIGGLYIGFGDPENAREYLLQAHFENEVLLN